LENKEIFSTAIYYSVTQEDGKDPIYNYYTKGNRGLELISGKPNYTYKFSNNNKAKEFECTGRIIYQGADLEEVENLYLGNGLYADIYYTISGIEVLEK
jgi:hypothetical protein